MTNSNTHNVTIYHNPKCGTSRNTLALIENTGITPHVILYMETPPSKEVLSELIQQLNVPVRDMMRHKGTSYDELNLDDPKWTDEQLIDLMTQQPILINRPIVITSKGVLLCRPSERVLDILPLPQLGAFTKEDGEPVIDAQGHRIVSQS